MGPATTRSPWTPVPGLIASHESRHLRAAVQRLGHGPATTTPEFLIDVERDWLAHNTKANAAAFLAPLTTIVRIPTASSETADDQRFTEVSVVATPDDTVGSLMTKIWAAHEIREDAQETVVLKVTGRREFLVDQTRRLQEHAHVRDCLLKQTPLKVTVVPVLLHEKQEAAAEEQVAAFLLRAPQVDEDDVVDASEERDGLVDEDEAAERPFSIKIHGVRNLPRLESSVGVRVRIDVFHGDQRLTQGEVGTTTELVQPQDEDFYVVEWWEAPWIPLGLDAAVLKAATRLQLTVLRDGGINDGASSETGGEDNGKRKETAKYVMGVNLFDVDGFLARGRRQVTLWSDADECSWGPVPYGVARGEPYLDFEFSRFALSNESETSSGNRTGDKCAAKSTPEAEGPSNASRNKRKETKNSAGRDRPMLSYLRRQVLTNVPFKLTVGQKALLRKYHERLMDAPELLPTVLSCVNWLNQDEVEVAMSLLYKWAQPDHPAAYLDLLDKSFVNEGIREFVVEKLRLVPDATFKLLLPQLIQALKCEMHVVSPLALLERGLQSPHWIGLDLFWLLKVETYSIRYREHFGTILNEYVNACTPRMRTLLQLQAMLFSADGMFDWALDKVKAAINGVRDRETRQQNLRAEHEAINEVLPRKFVLPFDARAEVGKIVMDKCRMWSKWMLVFENGEGGGAPLSDSGKVSHTNLHDMLGRGYDDWIPSGVDSAEFANFLDLCCTAYNVLRRHLLMSFLLPIVPVEMSAWTHREDIRCMCTLLVPDISEDAARKHVEEMIKTLLSTQSRDGMFGRVRTPDTTDGFLAGKDLDSQSTIWNDLDLLRLRIECSDVHQESLMGSNGKSEVWRGHFQSQDVAIKRLTKKDAIKRLSMKDASRAMANAIALASNLKAIATLRHPNVVNIIGVAWEKVLDAQIISEYVDCGDLRTLLDSSEEASFTWADFKCQVAIDVANAFQYLHSLSPRVPVACLTSRKVLVTTSGQAKVNFLRAGDAHSDHKLRWTAPEVIKGDAASDRSDIYSLGVLLCELDTTDPPYHDAMNPNGAKMENALISRLVVDGKLKPTLADDCPEPIAALTRQCLSLDPALRPSAAAICYALREIRKNEL